VLPTDVAVEIEFIRRTAGSTGVVAVGLCLYGVVLLQPVIALGHVTCSHLLMLLANVGRRRLLLVIYRTHTSVFQSTSQSSAPDQWTWSVYHKDSKTTEYLYALLLHPAEMHRASATTLLTENSLPSTRR